MKTGIVIGTAIAVAVILPQTASANLVGDSVNATIANLGGNWNFEGGANFASPAIVTDPGIEFVAQLDDLFTGGDPASGVSVQVDILPGGIEVIFFGSIVDAGANAGFDILVTGLDWVDDPAGEIISITGVGGPGLIAGSFAVTSFGPHSISFHGEADAFGSFNAFGGAFFLTGFITSDVPAPGALALFAVGLFGRGSRTRRRSR